MSFYTRATLGLDYERGVGQGVAKDAGYPSPHDAKQAP